VDGAAEQWEDELVYLPQDFVQQVETYIPHACDDDTLDDTQMRYMASTLYDAEALRKVNLEVSERSSANLEVSELKNIF
jgi:hypothetical protein